MHIYIYIYVYIYIYIHRYTYINTYKTLYILHGVMNFRLVKGENIGDFLILLVLDILLLCDINYCTPIFSKNHTHMYLRNTNQKCLYVHMYMYIYTHIYTDKHVYMYELNKYRERKMRSSYVAIHMQVHIFIHIHTHIQAYRHTYIHVCIHAHI